MRLKNASKLLLLTVFVTACDGDLSSKVDRSERRISELEMQQQELNVSLNQTQAQLEAFIASTATNINNLETLIGTSVDNASTALQYNINVQQTQINQALTLLAEMETEDRVVSYIDPCGNGTGYDEIIMRTSNNNLIVYFEQGSKRFLTLLSPGSYMTTDTQGCHFTVNSNMEVIY